MRFINVDLPEPDGPMMATYSLRLMLILTPRNACTCCSDPMSYVFHRSSVQMMHSAGGAFSTVDTLSTCVAILLVSSLMPALAPLLGLFVFLLGCGVVYLHTGSVLKRAKNFIAAGDDLVAFLETIGHFDIGGAGDTGLYLLECRLALVDHEDAL